ncbi:MAG: ATP-binding protein [Bacteroidetes bacterium]|nr:ATP-binding protein [Bacteroidota bacterium]
MPNKNWEDTKIYQALKTRQGDYAAFAFNFLNRPEVMPAIEQILNKGGTTPKDFTLHDAEHSFRVAERMWELMPEKTKSILSDYDLTLLLLSAYLHDIGMSPDYDSVQRHYLYLVEKKEGLSEDEITQFQRWVDNNERLQSLDIRKDLVKDISLSNYILSYYIRHKHNDWSGDWIKKNFSGTTWKNYGSWWDDLIKVCKSHHYGLDHLLGSGFDPRIVAPGVTVHLRYLAICLRVADVMENDPERTPEVLLTHRAVSPGSLVYWQKDSQFTLLLKEHQYSVYARPERALLHKAVEETVQWIENELKLSNELIRLKPLNYSPVGAIEGYEWVINPQILCDIQPRDNAYVFIHGAFRPNMAKILELLGGNQLYGDSIAAYRELIQNCFDAIKEKIAYAIIMEDRDVSEIPTLAKLNKIQISLEQRPDGCWLVCKDQGVGMTRGIIEQFFLVNGVSKRHEIRELERQCEERGFHLGRTGQFGIGVLSYFMLADRLIIKTKRHSNTGYDDDESVAWQFEINGTHDFGELKRLSKSPSGTTIELRLREDVVSDIVAWDEKFRDFLKKDVSKTPCALSYESFLDEDGLQLGPGWTNSPEDIKLNLLEELEEHLEDDDFDAAPLIEEIAAAMDFIVEEGEYQGLGKYRIYIPYFKLLKGNSFYYMRERIQADRHYIVEADGKGYCWIPNNNLSNVSLKGMNIESNLSMSDPDTSLSFFVEFDLEVVDEKRVSVSRRQLMMEELATELKTFFETRLLELVNSRLAEFDNPYAVLNQPVNLKIPTEFYWTYRQPENRDLLWEKIKFPMIESNQKLTTLPNLTYRGQPLQLMRILQTYDGISARWDDGLRLEYEAGFIEEDPYTPLPVVTSLANVWNSGLEMSKIKLPEEWNRVLIMRPSNKRLFLNTNHVLYASFDAKSYIDWSELTDNTLPEEPTDLDCVNYLVHLFSRKLANTSETYFKNKQESIKRALEQLKLKEFYALSGRLLVIIGVNKTVVYSDYRDKTQYLSIIKDPEYLIEKATQ